MEFHLAPSTKELLEEPTVTQIFKIIHIAWSLLYTLQTTNIISARWFQSKFPYSIFLRNMFVYYSLIAEEVIWG